MRFTFYMKSGLVHKKLRASKNNDDKCKNFGDIIKNCMPKQQGIYNWINFFDENNNVITILMNQVESCLEEVEKND
jgi:hypothetical protein